MSAKNQNVFFNEKGLYPNVVTLFVMRSKQKFKTLDGGFVMGEDVLRHWQGPDVSPEHSGAESTWVAPARVTEGGGIRVKREGMWFVLCPDMN